MTHMPSVLNANNSLQPHQRLLLFTSVPTPQTRRYSHEDIVDRHFRRARIRVSAGSEDLLDFALDVKVILDDLRT